MTPVNILRMDHIVLYAADPEKSLDFYSRIPGIDTGKETGRSIVKIGKQKLNIHPYPPILSPVAKNPRPGGQKFSLVVDGSLPLYLRQIEAARIAIDDSGANPRIADPDGNLIELFQGIKESQPICAGIAGLTVSVSDPNALLHFYARLGRISEQDFDTSRQILFESGFLQLESNQVKLYGTSDFCLVTDMPLEKAYQLMSDMDILSDLGIVSRTGALGPIKSFYLRDPDRNLVEIAKYERQNIRD